MLHDCWKILQTINHNKSYVVYAEKTGLLRKNTPMFTQDWSQGHKVTINKLAQEEKSMKKSLFCLIPKNNEEQNHSAELWSANKQCKK